MKYANIIELNGEIILDLTKDTVSAETLAQGATAHDSKGQLIVGTAVIGDTDLSSATVCLGEDNKVYAFVNGQLVGIGVAPEDIKAPEVEDNPDVGGDEPETPTEPEVNYYEEGYYFYSPRYNSTCYVKGDYLYEGITTDYNPDDEWDIPTLNVMLATKEELEEAEIDINYPVVDRNQTSYGEILPQVDGLYVGCLSNTFADCTSLTVAPEIPERVHMLNSTFANCTSLETVPSIPQGVYNMDWAFNGCTSITVIPSLPQWNGNGLSMIQAFEGCTSLVDLSNLTIDCPSNLQAAFKDCTSLRYAPVVSAAAGGLWQMDELYSGCTSLEGDVTIDISEWDVPNLTYTDCFAGVDMSNINLVMSYLRNEVGSTGLNWVNSGSSIEISGVTIDGFVEGMSWYDLPNEDGLITENSGYVFIDGKLLIAPGGMFVYSSDLIDTELLNGDEYSRYELREVSSVEISGETVEYFIEGVSWGDHTLFNSNIEIDNDNDVAKIAGKYLYSTNYERYLGPWDSAESSDLWALELRDYYA